MTWLKLAWANLRLSPLTSGVNVLLMTLGTASVVLLILAGDRFSQTLTRDASGIDLVVGAQGSPVQLILSAVYHADVPPGNIPLEQAERWMNDSRIRHAAPLSLGDSIRGFRIVGTTPEYLTITGASVASGELWHEPMQAVIGSAVAAASGMEIGSVFTGAHGLSDGGHEHEAEPYRVVGILAPKGTIVDRLVLTSLESVWELHGQDDHEDHEDHDDEGHEGHEHEDQEDHDHASHEHEDHEDHDHEGHEHEDHEDHDHESHEHEDHDHEGHEHEGQDLEVTAVLLQYGTPLAAMSMPREINTLGGLQAAAPAMEITRILQLVGFGIDGLQAFAWILIVTACLSVFAALYGSLRSRRGDLAMLRCLGATRGEVFLALLSEGMLLSLGGIVLGYALGHGAIALVSVWLESSRGLTLAALQWAPAETQLLFVLLAASVISAAIPAIQAYRTDVAESLAEG